MEKNKIVIQELEAKLVCTMTGRELLTLLRSPSGEAEGQKEKRYVYGIAGIATLFGCSIPTASRIKRSGVIDEAITQVGRKIVIDAEKALTLVSQSKNKSK